MHGSLQRRRAADEGRQAHAAAADDIPAAGRRRLLRPALADGLQAVLREAAAPNLAPGDRLGSATRDLFTDQAASYAARAIMPECLLP